MEVNLTSCFEDKKTGETSQMNDEKKHGFSKQITFEDSSDKVTSNRQIKNKSQDSPRIRILVSEAI